MSRYHLSLYDNAEVVFEKDTIGGASTAKSAGTVCLFDDSLRNRYWDVRLYGFESYLKMEAEKRVPPDLIKQVLWWSQQMRR